MLNGGWSYEIVHLGAAFVFVVKSNSTRSAQRAPAARTARSSAALAAVAVVTGSVEPTALHGAVVVVTGAVVDVVVTTVDGGIVPRVVDGPVGAASFELLLHAASTQSAAARNTAVRRTHPS
jgi:hypothetical protein